MVIHEDGRNLSLTCFYRDTQLFPSLIEILHDSIILIAFDTNMIKVVKKSMQIKWYDLGNQRIGQKSG